MPVGYSGTYLILPINIHLKSKHVFNINHATFYEVICVPFEYCLHQAKLKVDENNCCALLDSFFEKLP